MTAAERAQPQAPPLLRPGWYAWDFSVEESAEFHAFQLANRGGFRTVTTWTTNTHAIVLMQVHAPLRWTLRGKPAKAPRGAKTTIEDLVKLPAPSAGFVVAVEEITGQTYDRLRRSAAISGPGLIFWGGALALLAWNLTPDSDDAPSGGKEGEE
jgi:hypothetical protein